MRIPFVLLSILVGIPACAPDNRCGDDFDYVDGSCVPVADSESEAGTDSTEDSDINTNDDTDSETSSDTDVSALGATCTSGGTECDDVADYCVMQPGAASGYCAPSDCDPSNDDCPDGYGCCNMTAQSMVYCLKTADLALLTSLGLCVE